ncbi:MAG: UDP-2,3-diacylglucosamine diphosphatase, partial [Alphaproteobacteria bacterium]
MKKKNSRTAQKQKPDHYPVIVISDTHLGMGNTSTDLLVEFLQNTTCDRLILNGDIIDGWRINRQKEADFPEAQKRVLDAINRKIAEGVDVIYIPGNHDGELRRRGLAGKNVLGARLEHEFEFTDPKGRKIFVCHGDRFDPMQQGASKLDKLPKALKYPIGAGYILMVDKGYDAASRISSAIDRVSEHVLHRSIGLFSKVRTTLEGLSGSKGNMEQSAIDHAQKNNYDGIICGHFHMSAKRDSGGKLYLNSGDWVES